MPSSSVGIATDYWLDGPGSNPGGNEIFRPSRPALRPTQPLVQWVPGLSRGWRQPEHGANPHLVPKVLEKGRAIPLLTLRACVACKKGENLPTYVPFMECSFLNFLHIFHHIPGSSVGIASDYGLDGPGSNPGGDKIFRLSRLAPGPTQPFVQWVTGLSGGWWRRPGHRAAPHLVPKVLELYLYSP